jgi:hypothetical protein
MPSTLTAPPWKRSTTEAYRGLSRIIAFGREPGSLGDSVGITCCREVVAVISLISVTPRPDNVGSRNARFSVVTAVSVQVRALPLR